MWVAAPCAKSSPSEKRVEAPVRAGRSHTSPDSALPIAVLNQTHSRNTISSSLLPPCSFIPRRIWVTRSQAAAMCGHGSGSEEPDDVRVLRGQDINTTDHLRSNRALSFKCRQLIVKN